MVFYFSTLSIDSETHRQPKSDNIKWNGKFQKQTIPNVLNGTPLPSRCREETPRQPTLSYMEHDPLFHPLRPQSIHYSALITLSSYLSVRTTVMVSFLSTRAITLAVTFPREAAWRR